MDRLLLEKAMSKMPIINPDIANGLATKQVPSVLQYVDRIWQSLDFPEGLVYEGLRRVTPRKKFEVLTSVRDNKIKYELAPSDFYMVAFDFTLEIEGVKESLPPKYLLLPYVSDAGIIEIRGKKFAIHPVMSDRSFSVGTDSVFKKFNRMMFTFERLTYHFDCNGHRASSYVAWSWIHHEARKRFSKRSSDSGKVIYSTLANYLFAQHGVTNTFKKYCNVDVHIGESDITHDKYPEDEWFICKTIGLVPKLYAKEYYEYSKLRIAVRKEEMTPLVMSLITAFFYMVDYFPQITTLEDIDEVWLWKLILGEIIIEQGTSQGLIIKSIEEHQRSVYEYIDPIARDELKEDGYDFEDIYDIFIYVSELLTNARASNDEEIASLYGKQVVVLRYLMNELVQNINKSIMYKLRNVSNKKGFIEVKDVNKIMNSLRTDSMASLTNHAVHPEVTTVSTASDNYLVGITNEVVTQDKASGGGSKSRINLNDPAKHLHASIAEVASYNLLPKSGPTGTNRLSCFLQLNSKYIIQRNPELVDVITKTQRMINANPN
jgi:hypothetical protein